MTATRGVTSLVDARANVRGYIYRDSNKGVASSVDARASVRGYIYRDSNKGGGITCRCKG